MHVMFVSFLCFSVSSLQLAGMVVVWYALNVVRKCMETHALAHTHEMSHMHDETIQFEARLELMENGAILEKYLEVGRLYV